MLSSHSHIDSTCTTPANISIRSRIRQHTSAYVSIPQQWPARAPLACFDHIRTLAPPVRQHTSAYVSIRSRIRQHTSACFHHIRTLAPPVRQHTSAFVSIRSRIRQHTSACFHHIRTLAPPVPFSSYLHRAHCLYVCLHVSMYAYVCVYIYISFPYSTPLTSSHILSQPSYTQ